MGVVDAIRWACALCDCCIQNDSWVEQQICIKLCCKVELLHGNYSDDSEGHSYGQLVIGSFITTTHLLTHQISYRIFLQIIKSRQVTQPPTGQIWHPVISGFSPNWNHLWKGRDFRLLMRFRKIQWGSWWQSGELCEVPRCLLWSRLRCHFPLYNVSCTFYLSQ